MTYQIAIRRLVWVYFLLLIFEGVLRKWVLPGIHEYLIFVRDPVVLLIYLLTFLDKQFPWKLPIMRLTLGLALLSLIASPLGRWFDLITLAYGFRVQFLHVPLIFVIARYFNRDQVVQMGRAILIMSIPIVLLMAAQFKAPAGSWLNAGVGGEVDAQIMGAQGHYRPSGPFTFISGPGLFFPLLAAFWLAALVHRTMARYWLVMASGAVLVVAIPISVSRSLAMSVGLVGVGLLGAAVIRPRLIVFLPRVMLVVAVVILAGAGSTVFRAGTSAFAERWETSTGGENGIRGAILDRIIDGYLSPFRVMANSPLFGYGLGTGTNVAAKRISGHVGFLTVEGEWDRIMLEMGPVLGLGYLFLRIWLSLQLVWVSWRALLRGDVLPWLITAAVFQNVLNGQWGPPTGHGFAIIGAGIVLAAAGDPSQPVPKRRNRHLRPLQKSTTAGAHTIPPEPPPSAATAERETLLDSGRPVPARAAERNID